MLRGFPLSILADQKGSIMRALIYRFDHVFAFVCDLNEWVLLYLGYLGFFGALAVASLF